jgi:hypothetical protein
MLAGCPGPANGSVPSTRIVGDPCIPRRPASCSSAITWRLTEAPKWPASTWARRSSSNATLGQPGTASTIRSTSPPCLPIPAATVDEIVLSGPTACAGVRSVARLSLYVIRYPPAGGGERDPPWVAHEPEREGPEWLPLTGAGGIGLGLRAGECHRLRGGAAHCAAQRTPVGGPARPHGRLGGRHPYPSHVVADDGLTGQHDRRVNASVASDRAVKPAIRPHLPSARTMIMCNLACRRRSLWWRDYGSGTHCLIVA